MSNDKHTAFRIVLGTGVEYAVIILGALKLLQQLDKLLAWCVEGMSDKMIALGVAGIVLLILAAILYDHRNAEDEINDEFYERFGGDTDA